MNAPTYNFKLQPEAIWLIVNTVVGAVLIQVLAFATGLDEIPEWGDFKLWLIALGIGAIRTLVGVVLAVAAGQFTSKPG